MLYARARSMIPLLVKTSTLAEANTSARTILERGVDTGRRIRLC
jgi:hypothetical protein